MAAAWTAPVATLLGCVRGMAEGVDARLHARADRLARALEALRARLAALEEGDRAHAA